MCYLKAVLCTLAAYVLGYLWDANFDAFYCFRILLPTLAMGLCILHELKTKK